MIRISHRSFKLYKRLNNGVDGINFKETRKLRYILIAFNICANATDM
jgi:hypothetical protein